MEQWYMNCARKIGRKQASYRYAGAYGLLVSVLINEPLTYEERAKLGVKIIEVIEAESRATDWGL